MSRLVEPRALLRVGHEVGAFTGTAHRRVGKLELAEGGTLFLDEIASMPCRWGSRSSSCGACRSGWWSGWGARGIPVDCRVLGASKADLRKEVAAGRFREDLFYRLDAVSLELPPLRERREDIPLLFAWFAARASERYRRSAPAWSTGQMDRWMEYDLAGKCPRTQERRGALQSRHSRDRRGRGARPRRAVVGGAAPSGLRRR